MQDEKQVLVQDLKLKSSKFGFCVRWSYLYHWADVEAFEYIGMELDPQRKFFNRKDWSVSPDPVYSIEEAEPYLKGFIKWDGCSEFEFHKRHFCGPSDYRTHFELLEALYKRSRELMPAGVEYGWDT